MPLSRASILADPDAALRAAALACSPEDVGVALAAGGRPGRPDERGRFALGLLGRSGERYWKPDIVECARLLLAAGADPLLGSPGFTALHEAARFHNDQAVEAFIELGFPLQGALARAAGSMDNQACLLPLLAAGADPFERVEGLTAREWAMDRTSFGPDLGMAALLEAAELGLGVDGPQGSPSRARL